MNNLASGLVDWSKERFPFVNIISGFVMYFMIATVAKKIGIGEAQVSFWEVLTGGLSVTLLFLLMRISDEHKDYQIDLKLFPQRVLQSGRISLFHLRILGGLAILVQSALCLWMDGGLGLVTLIFIVNVLVALLLNREFFIGSWLRNHMMVYALSHMIVAVSAAYWIIVMALGQEIQSQHLVLLLLPYWSGMVFEIARKSFGEEENREGLESYSMVFGHGRSAFLTFFFAAISFACYVYLLQLIAPSSYKTILGSASILVIFSIMLLRHKRGPTKKTRKILEGVAAFFISYNYLSLGFLSLD